MKLVIGLISFLVLFNSCDESSQNNIVTSNKTGKEIYVLNCAVCHGEDGTEGSAGAANLKYSLISDAQIEQVVLKGNNKGMMPYEGLIDEGAELDSLIKFVKNLRN